MKRNDIQTARVDIFDDAQTAQDYVKSLDYNVDHQPLLQAIGKVLLFVIVMRKRFL